MNDERNYLVANKIHCLAPNSHPAEIGSPMANRCNRDIGVWKTLGLGVLPPCIKGEFDPSNGGDDPDVIVVVLLQPDAVHILLTFLVTLKRMSWIAL